MKEETPEEAEARERAEDIFGDMILDLERCICSHHDSFHNRAFSESDPKDLQDCMFNRSCSCSEFILSKTTFLIA